MKIKIDSPIKVTKFVKTARKIPNKLYLKSNNYVINAKSFLGVFSLDLSKEIELEAEGDFNKEIFKEWEV